MTAQDKRAAAAQIQGGRDYQEDDFAIHVLTPASDDDAGETLLVLADGMGGHAGGAEASAIAVERFADRFTETDGDVRTRLQAGLDAANAGIGRAAMEDPDLEGMGCTLVGLYLSEHGAQWISVGDSPLYLISSGQIVQINDDHSMAPVLKQLVKEGRMTDIEAARDPRRNALRSAVVGEELTLIDLPHDPMPVHNTDVLVLASDGLQTLSDSEIGKLVWDNRDQDEAALAQLLVDAVDAAGKARQDNTTVLVFRADRLLGDGPRDEDVTADRTLADDEFDALIAAADAKSAEGGLPIPALIVAGLAVVTLGIVAFLALG